ncbi:thermonuclease family protein [Flavivirga algicola]|uniref:Thermonuclease family protein n=1 Tax=Flavivirga algicola TaxID=2729136 RepID=A0ABX1RXZ8_9FLAO|nr:thermonuclease family protein [Flavivirga algicola]NMH87658.1 thermonuclease family protein [Flavivirga algicola]
MYKFCLVLLFLISLSFHPNNSNAKKDSIIGKAVAITDGDTFKLLTKDSTLIKVRLANIDCPEKKQPFSKKAKQFVVDAIFSKTVTIYVLKKDRYQRYIANVIYDDSLNLSCELVRHGLAWHYVKYSKDSILQSLEDKAKLNRVGLWADRNAVAPWIWRSSKKKKIKH